MVPYETICMYNHVYRNKIIMILGSKTKPIEKKRLCLSKVIIKIIELKFKTANN